MKWKIFVILVLFLSLLAVGLILYQRQNRKRGGEKMNNIVSPSVIKKADKPVLLVIAPKNFRDEELFQTQEELEKAGFKTEIVSQTTGVIHGALGGTVEVEKIINNVNISQYSALVFVGGGGASVYFNSPQALNLARGFASQGKVVAAICIAPSILANAGLLKGKKATAFRSEQKNLVQNGTIWVNKPVVVDGKIVTASGPAAAREFGQKIAELLRSQ